MKMTEISWEILEDGTVSVDTEDLSGPNHYAADELLKELSESLGGVTVVKKKHKFHVHHDLSGALHEHTHDGHTHQH